MTTYYSIFDVNKPIMEANKEIPSDSPTKAIKAYLKLIGEDFKSIKIDGGNFARIKAEPFYIKDGVKYRHYNKRSIWVSVTN